MNLYEYQRSRSFIARGPVSLRFSISNFVSLETAGPIEAKFYMEPPWDGRTKFYSNNLGHMTKMAAMPIYGKNHKQSSSLEPKSRWPWNLVCSIGYSSSTKFIQVTTMGWPWPILRHGLIWSLLLLYGDTFDDVFRNYCSLWYQVGRSSQPNEYMKL